MEIRKKAEDKILDVAYDLRARSQAQFINKTASKEGWDFETAWAVCHGVHPTIVRPDLTLGFKLADPILQTSFNLARKKNREAAREKFREELPPEEQELFDGIDHDDTAKKFKGELKKKRKKGEGLRGEKQTKPLGVGFLSPLHGAFSTSTFQYKVLQTDKNYEVSNPERLDGGFGGFQDLGLHYPYWNNHIINYSNWNRQNYIR